MKLTVDKKVFRKFPKLNLGVIIVKGMDNSGRNTVVEKLLKEIEQYCRDTYVIKGLSDLPTITNWKKIYKTSRKHYSAMEPLLYNILKGKPIPKVNSMVNVYTYSMLKHMIPIGGDDLDKVDGDIKVKIAEGYETLLTQDGIEHPEEGELCYTDDKEVLARRFSWKESKKTKINHYTKNAVIYLDALPPIEESDLKKIMKELKDLINTFCKGRISSRVLNKNRLEVRL